MTSIQPKISIVTVALNSAAGLEKTLQSIVSQDYQNLELIVIDGGSTDGTTDIIKKYTARIAYWVSEPDKGIFHAMNKGIKVCKGEWINFMNAGDLFHNQRAISAVFAEPREAFDVIYGDSVAKYPSFSAMRKVLPINDLWKGMICAHPAMFFRADMLRVQGYREELWISADFELTFRLYVASRIFYYVPVTVAVFDTRGLSNKRMEESAQSSYQIVRSIRELTESEHRYHKRYILKSRITDLIYRFLPGFAIETFLKKLYRTQIIQEPENL